MNETILNGLLNLFAIFASLAKIESDQARQAVNSYLTSHFGIRSHKEYMELYAKITDAFINKKPHRTLKFLYGFSYVRSFS